MGIVVAFVAVSALGIIQTLSSIALRSDARVGSWPALVPPQLAAAVDRLDPAIPIPPALRLVFARSALASHDLERTRAEVARLSSSRDRFAIEAGLADARGDTAGATTAYLAGGDLAALELRVHAYESQHRFAQALALQRATIERLRNDPAQRDALAEATFGLGRLDQRHAYDRATPRAVRRSEELRALAAYERAVELSPLSQQNLLALGNQQLNVGDLTAAKRTFERARDNDPTSADAFVGLGDTALRSGDVTTARNDLTRARLLEPNSAAARRLAARIGS